MKINLQSESPWLEDVFAQRHSSDCVNLRSGDGGSLSIPVSYLAASSEYLSHILHSSCCSCTYSNTVFHLPSVSGFSLKLLSQILSVGETEELSEEIIESCLKNVEDVFELLRCNAQLVTKLSCSRASSGLKVVSFESLAHSTDIVKEEFKEMVDVYESEDMDAFYSQLEVEKEVGTEYCYHEKGSLTSSVELRPLRGEGFDQSKSDFNHNKDWKLASISATGRFVSTSWKDSSKTFRNSEMLSKKEKEFSDISRQSRRRPTGRQDSNNDRRRIENSLGREFQCSSCDLGFFTSVGLERHSSDKHADDFSNRQFKCAECNLSYYTENSLDKHKHEKHGNENIAESNTTVLTPICRGDYWEGPFICTMCAYSCNSTTRFSNHWNEMHTAVTHKVSFIDTATSTTVNLCQAFAFIVQCGLCGVVRCANGSLNRAVSGITIHHQRNHHDQFGTGNLSDMYKVLQDGQQSDQLKFDAAVVNGPYMDSTALEKIPIIGHQAEFNSRKRSLSKKGYLGPYHCLSEGCSFVCGKFSHTTQKILLDHWSLKHGDVKSLLFLDMPSFSIINVKIICDNLGYCSYVGCDKLIFASKRDLYPMYVLNHWKNNHPSSDDSFNPNMCKSISIKQIPDITEEEAVALVRKPIILSWMKNGTNEDDHSISKCAISGCEENVTSMTYASHFSLKHKELPSNNILVTTNDGRKLTCQDLFKSAIQCRLCSHISVGGHVRQCMRNHWVREHKEKNIEQMSFIDIMPASSGQVKELVNSENITTDIEQKLQDNVDDDINEVSIDDLL